MKMVISEYKLVAGLINSSDRSWINKEIKEKGYAKILIDYYVDGYNGGKGRVTPFPFKISNQALAKRNELIYLTQRYNTNQLVLRICRIDIVVKGAPALGCAKQFFELTVKKPKK
mgnify:FL=1